MIQIAEKLLRKHPDRITLLAPFTTFILTILVGTGHVVYTLMPIICDIALKKGIRPERPCSIASIASQIGITCFSYCRRRCRILHYIRRERV